MIGLLFASLIGLALGIYVGRNLGWDAAVDHYADESIGKAEAQRERDHRGALGRAPFVAVGLFVVAMLVLGAVAR